MHKLIDFLSNKLFIFIQIGKDLFLQKLIQIVSKVIWFFFYKKKKKLVHIIEEGNIIFWSDKGNLQSLILA